MKKQNKGLRVMSMEQRRIISRLGRKASQANYAKKVDALMIGKRFGRLVVVERRGFAKNGSILWLAKCDCGATKIVFGTGLRSGGTRSCGCLFRDMQARRAVGAVTNTKHPLYDVWMAMIARCENRSNKNFKTYGARGIRVCKRWRTSFRSFVADVGVRPLGATLERVKNHLGYRPGNVRWATQREQTRNTRRNVILQHGGLSLCVADWAEKLGMKPGTIHMRIRLGWSVEKIITHPIRRW